MCSNRQICPLGCHCSDKAPHSYAELRRCAARRLMPHTLQLTVFCCMQPHSSWKKPNSFIRISCCSSSITLKSSLWRRQGTEDLDLLQRWGWGKKTFLNKFLRRCIRRRSHLHLQLCAMCEHVCISGIYQAVGLLAMRLSVFRTCSLCLDVTLCSGNCEIKVHWKKSALSLL